MNRLLRAAGRITALLLPLAALLAAGCGSERGVRVVLMTFDTLRFDAYAEGGEMPRTRERLSAGLEFESSFAATATTQPTHATLLTGLHPWVHGLVSNRHVLDARLTTVPEILHEEGFETAAVVASFPLSRRFGFDQGFDHYDDDLSEGISEDKLYSLADDVVARTFETLAALSSPKQFLWVHFFDPHAPYGDTGQGDLSGPDRLRRAAIEEPESVERRLVEARRLYMEDVSFLDRTADRLLARLEEEQDRYVTHLVVTADHGEALGEDGSVGHGRRLLPAQIHVPLVILSEAVEAGRDGTVVGSVDVAPTLLSLAGVKPETLSALMAGGGRDLTAGRVAPRAAGMRRTFSPGAVEVRLDGSRHSLDDLLFYVVGEGGQIVRGNGSGLLTAPASLAPSEAERLAEVFAGFERSLAGSAADEEDEPEVTRALRALGYVD